MQGERDSLNAILQWPQSAPAHPFNLSIAGFSYTGHGTEIECFRCRCRISEWNNYDQVMSVHLSRSPNCPLVYDSILSTVSPESSFERYPSPAIHRVSTEDGVLRNYNLRYITFINWEGPEIEKVTLARAGLYHRGGGVLRCAWCGGEFPTIGRATAALTPIDIHRRNFPHCILATTEGVAEEEANSLAIPSTSQSRSLNGIRPSAAPEQNQGLMSSTENWRELGVVGATPRHASRACLSARLGTFARWPVTSIIEPKTLADAGFFYTGIDDQVRCFYCDGGLASWESSDVPWKEHARWFPNCGYVMLIKGEEFITSCRVPAPTSPDPEQNTSRIGVMLPVSESHLEDFMVSDVVLSVLGVGLDATRVRRAVTQRMQATGVPFSSPIALIDAVLHDEQPPSLTWSDNSHSGRLASAIIQETLREISPNAARAALLRNTLVAQRPTVNLHPNVENKPPSTLPVALDSDANASSSDSKPTPSAGSSGAGTSDQTVKQAEEIRQLRESRLCKVCMDNEVSVVFLPCGHMVTCPACATVLTMCPMCRAEVRAMVRAYLA